MLENFADLSLSLVADACVRCGVPLRTAPAGIAAVVAGRQIAGRALPARHYGSVDVFLEALGRAGPGMSWSWTTAGGRTRRASATWWCWRPRRPDWGTGGVGAAPRYAGIGGDRPSGVQLWQLPGRAVAPE